MSKNADMKQGAVTFLDVLGWKGIWEKDKGAIDNLLGLISDIRKLSEHLTLEAPEQLRGINTNVLSVSDTIAIFTPGEAYYSLKVHADICRFAIPESIKRGIPIRGATAYGEFSTKENVMVGPAVDESASWHESTNWIGVILTPSAVFKLGNEVPTEWADYKDIPFKNKVIGLRKCVDWKYDEADLNEVFFELGKPHLPSIAPKYLNTKIFLERDANSK